MLTATGGAALVHADLATGLCGWWIGGLWVEGANVSVDETHTLVTRRGRRTPALARGGAC